MIDRLHLQNFQKHDQLDIKLDPTITTIVGPSDVGKSSILRALRWLVLNRPRGDGFIQDGADGCSVKIRVDGKTVERMRDKSNNTYRVGKQTYKAFGNEPPESVVKLLNLGEDNFQGQHDPQFWFSLTPGEVARELNGIVDLTIIDRVMADVASRLRKAKAEREVVEGRLKIAEEERERLEFVPRLEKDHKRLTELGAETEKEVGRLSSRIGGLGRLVEQIGEVQQVVGRAVPDVSGLARMGREWKGIFDRVEGLKRVTDEARGLVGEIERLGRDRTEAEGRLREESGGLCPICGGELE